ncbi:hypothetical protein V6N11_051525 [Hibiscus sabdariffa]|uniref:Uncharacterized protein n=1 Tax=Hibiscus sabdariffa TaxID=183260 RepID=A0ABR2U7E3_9ROSI
MHAFVTMLMEVYYVVKKILVFVKKMHAFVKMLMEVYYDVKKMHVFVKKMPVFAADKEKTQELGPHVSYEHLNL